MKTRASFSPQIQGHQPEQVDSDIESRVAMALPRNPMASCWPHYGGRRVLVRHAGDAQQAAGSDDQGVTALTASPKHLWRSQAHYGVRDNRPKTRTQREIRLESACPPSDLGPRVRPSRLADTCGGHRAVSKGTRQEPGAVNDRHVELGDPRSGCHG